MGKSAYVTWQQAEDALLAAVEYLGAMPDRERGFLSAGSRSCWPQVIRSVREGDYGEGQGMGGEARPRQQLGRKEADMLDRVLLSPEAVALAIPEHDRRMVGRVLLARLDGRGEGFRWSRIWQAEGGEAWCDKRGRMIAVTADALRKRYERAVQAVAVRMEAAGMGADAAV